MVKEAVVGSCLAATAIIQACSTIARNRLKDNTVSDRLSEGYIKNNS